MTLTAPRTPAHARNRFAWHVAAIVAALVFAFPVVVMIAGSLRQPGSPPPRSLELVPQPLSLDAYRSAFAQAPLTRSLLNSSIVAALAVPLSILTSSWAGFAIAQLTGRRRARLIAAVLILFMVPVTAVWIPRFAMFKAIGLTGTWIPLLAPALMGGSPFFVLLYALAFWRIPRDVYDAARIEGIGAWQTWRIIAMPLVKATTAAVGLLAFLLSWTNFIDALLYLDDIDTYTAPLALRFLEQLGPTNWPVLLAGSVVVTAPVIVAFVFAQRHFLQEERINAWLGR